MGRIPPIGHGLDINGGRFPAVPGGALAASTCACHHVRVHVGRPLLRALRATVFAVVCVLVSAAVHVLAGGSAVRPGALVVAAAATWAGAFALGSRQRGLGVLLTACFAAQYGMHQLFTAAAGPAPVQLTHAHGDSGLGMFLAHVAIAAMSAWWLERGESALATVVHLTLGSLWAALALLPDAPVEPRVTRRPRPHHESGRPRGLLLASGVRRRGPPIPISVH